MTLSPLEWMQVIKGAITEDPLVISQGVLNWPMYFYSVPKSSWTSCFFFFHIMISKENEKTGMTFKDEKYKDSFSYW